MKKNYRKVQNTKLRLATLLRRPAAQMDGWKRSTSPKTVRFAELQVKNTKRLFSHKNKQKYIPAISSKLSIKNTAYLGEIGRKVELSKRRKLQTPKKISLNSFKESYGSATLRSSAARRNGKAAQTRVGASAFAAETARVQSNNFRKYVLYFKKKARYTDKAAPIPGGNPKLSTGFVRKQKFYKKIFRAYRLFKTYLTFNKKVMNKLYRKRAANNNSIEFSILMHMDSLFYSSMRKSSLMLNAQRVFGSYFLNGKYATKKNFVLYRRNKAFLKDGDFCSRLSVSG